MSGLPKSMELDRKGIERLSLDMSAKGWLRKLLYRIEMIFRLIRDHQEAGGMKTKTWRIVELANGDLELQHKENGQWVQRGFSFSAS